MKVHVANGEQEAFLKALQFFCKKAVYKPIWDVAAKDFYGFCNESKDVEHTIRHQVFKIATTCQ